jgi:integrase
MVNKASKGKLSVASQTVEQTIDDYLAHCELEGRSPTTMREYKRIKDQVLVPQLGNIQADKLTAKQLNTLYAALQAKGNKATTIRRVHALISAALTYATKQEVMEQNVARLASPPRLQATQIDAPTPDEVKRILKAAEQDDPMLATVLLLAALTGARRGELCALRWSDVDWSAETLTVARSVYETAEGGWDEKDTKSHQVRKVGLDPIAVEALRRHREEVDRRALGLELEIPDNAFMFSISPAGSEPIRPDWLTKHAARAAEAAGVDTHLHALRHFSATQGIAAGFDPVTVGQRLGHRDPSVTLRVYSHAIEQRDWDLAAALGEKLALGSG